MSEIPSHNRLTWQWNWCYWGPGVLSSAPVRIICQILLCAFQGQLALPVSNSCWQRFWETVLHLWEKKSLGWCISRDKSEEGVLLPEVHVLDRDDESTEARSFHGRCLLNSTVQLLSVGSISSSTCLDWESFGLLMSLLSVFGIAFPDRIIWVSIQTNGLILWWTHDVMALLGCIQRVKMGHCTISLGILSLWAIVWPGPLLYAVSVHPGCHCVNCSAPSWFSLFEMKLWLLKLEGRMNTPSFKLLFYIFC